MITGASSGIGLSTVVYLAEKRYKVYAGIRDLTKKNSLLKEIENKNLEVEIVYLDLLDQGSVIEAVNKILRDSGSIDVLINNAGYGLKGFLECCSMEEIKSQFETNFFSQIFLIKCILPVMRNQRQGRIINISSIYAEFPFPAMSAYSAAKSGIEAVTGALRMELEPFNIQLCTIQPSGIKTNFDKSAILTRDLQGVSSAYYHPFKYYIEKITGESSQGLSAEIVAKKIYKALASKKMKRKYAVGKGAVVFMLLKSILPYSLLERSFKKIFKL